MLSYTKENDIITLAIQLPEGFTQQGIIDQARIELDEMATLFFGCHVRINGRCTTSLALYLGHRLAHITKSVSIFDPKENSYVLSVWH